MSLAVVVALGAAGVALEIAARRGTSRATAGQALAAAMRTRAGRATVLVTWLWLGVHFLAR